MPNSEDFSTSRRFRGMNAYHQPGDLPMSDMVDAANALVVGSDLVSRPGLQGVLTFANKHSDPVYVMGSYRNADGTTGIIYTSGGKVYHVVKSGSGVGDAPIEIKNGSSSFAINSATAVGTRLGHYFYFSDGQAGTPLYRANLDGGDETPYMNAPTAAPGATLTNTVIDALTSGSWTADSLSGSGNVNRLPNWDFSATTGSLPTGYTGYGADPDEGESSGQSGNWLLQDTPGEGVYCTDALANDQLANDASRYATQFFVASNVVQRDSTAESTLIIRIYGYSDAGGTDLAATVSHEFSVPYTSGQIATVEAVISFASFAVPIVSYRVAFEAGQKNHLGGSSLYAQKVVAFPFTSDLSTDVSGGMVKITQPQGMNYTGGYRSSTQPGTLGYGVGAAGSHLTHDYGSGNSQNWSMYDHVALSVSKIQGVANLNLSLAFRQDGSADRYYSNTFDISADGSVATLDISTVDKSVLSSFRYLELVLGGDFTVPWGNGVELFAFGPMTGSGNLSVGYSDYSYVKTEVDATQDMSNLVDVIESNPSPTSNSITPTVTQAEASVSLGTSLANATATTHEAIYRYGGVFSDNPAVGRLIAVVPIGSDAAMGTDARNPYYSWNHTTGILVDNTPDSYLLSPGVFPNASAAMINGRDTPPLGINAICSYNNRLICAVGSTLYVSWLLTPINPSAMYFTNQVASNDPYISIKGNTFTVGGAGDNDPIQALVGTNTAVVIEKMTSKALLQGYDGFTFNVQDYLKGTGVGCVAFRAACLLQNQECALSSSGVMGYDIASVTSLSQDIEPLLRPKGWDGAAAIPPAVFSGSCMAEWDRRLLLSAPKAAADTQNTVIWVLDTRQGGWTRWTFGATSIVSLTSATDASDCFLGGYDGMLYVIAGNADLASSDGTPAPIVFSVTSRGFGQESDEFFWLEDKMLWVSALLIGTPGESVALSAGNDSGVLKTLSNYTIPASGRGVIREHFNDVRGFYLTAGFSASSQNPVKLTALRAEIAEGARRSA